MNTILQQIGNEQVNGFSKPIDILLMQEQMSASSVDSYVNILNTIYGAGTYARAPYTGSGAGGLPAMVYRVSSVDVLETIAFGTVNTSSNARQTLRYKIRPDGYGDSAIFYVYNSHFKAGDSMDGVDRMRRNVEATSNRANADGLGAGQHIIYAGDFNLYDGNEPALITLKSAGNGQATDILNLPTFWNNSTYRFAHTQSPATSVFYDGQVTGGMDDRFDYQLMTSSVRDGEGIDYISGSYRAFGNNGTHPFNGAINNGANTWNPPGITVSASTIKTTLTQVTDHIPVVVDYQLPAKMSVSLGSVAPQVIVGASTGVAVTVSNSAPVVAAIGADELDYSVSGSGALTGSANGTANALAAGNVHNLTFDTSSPGFKSGSVSVNSSSQAAANNSFGQNVSTTVLAHSNGSFAPSIDQNALNINFGIRARGSTAPSQNFTLYNLTDPSGFTAGLDLDSILGSGDTSQLSSDLSTFMNLGGGGGNQYTASMNTSTVGIFSATYTIDLSDQDLPGATGQTQMSLVLSGRIALGGDANLDGFVNLNDFNVLAGNFGSSGAIWQMADFNNDQLVNLSDFNILAGNFGLSASPDGPSPQDWANLAAVVPEPGALLLIGLPGSLVLLRRRARR